MAIQDIFTPSPTAFDFVNMTPYEFGRNVLIPFILVYVILWAILEKFHIFNRRTNIIIALGISILLATTPAFGIFATYITNVSGTGMLVIFGLLIVGGTAIWALGRGKDIYYEQTDRSKKLKKLYKKRQEYAQKAKEAKERGDKKKYRTNMDLYNRVNEDIAAEESG